MGQKSALVQCQEGRLGFIGKVLQTHACSAGMLALIIH